MSENREIRKKRSYKWCFVPLCPNTSLSARSKIFVPVPKGEVRKKWFEIARRSDLTSLQNALYCCEDHLDLQECLENYRRVVEDKTASVRLKAGALPHKFDCQPDRQRTFSKPVRPGVRKRQTRKVLQEIESEVLSKIENIDSPRTAEDSVAPNLVNLNLVEEDIVNSDHDEASECGYVFADPISPCTSAVAETLPVQKDVGVQVRLLPKPKPKFRSKASTCVPLMQDASCSPIKIKTSVGLRKIQQESSVTTSSSTTCNLDDTLENCTEYLPSDETSEEALKQSDSARKQEIRRMKLLIIASKPKMYLGIPDNGFFILELLRNATGINVEDICLTLSKIKLNDTFARLGDEFGVSSSNANKIFRQTIPLVAHFLKQLIVWPSEASIKLNLPLPFRARYSNVQSIIDCFEIEIQKPGNVIHQSVTWSEYKKCNTLKYLISSTPDGTINFVSQGFGGRTTDAVIVQESEYLNKLPPNCAVMADRGFKHIEPLLQKSGCTLVRPPSVSSTAKPSKAEVMETRRIASLRIHIERVIRRIREFAILKPHAGVHHLTFDILDEIVTTAAGLINLQTPIIKQ